jgi:hypothetical protein
MRVRPVRGREVGGYIWCRGAQEIEEEKQRYLVDGRAVFVELCRDRVGRHGPLLRKCSVGVVSIVYLIPIR